MTDAGRKLDSSTAMTNVRRGKEVASATRLASIGGAADDPATDVARVR